MNEIFDKFLEQNKWDLRPRLLFLAVSGSRSYNLHSPESDYDYFGVYIPPLEYFFGFKKMEHWTYKTEEMDCRLFDIRKYMGLFLKGNPAVLESLYLKEDLYLVDTIAACTWRASRDKLISKNAFDAFSGYAHSQLNRMQNYERSKNAGEKRMELINTFGYDTKNAMHLFRLLHMGMEMLKTGELIPWRTHDRDFLLRVKAGDYTLYEIQQMAEFAFKLSKSCYDLSTLSSRPNEDFAQHLLLETVSNYLYEDIEGIIVGNSTTKNQATEGLDPRSLM